MKYLLSWVLTHLEKKGLDIFDDVDLLISKLSAHTAETILHKKINYNEKNMGIGIVVSNDKDLCLVNFNNNDKIIQVTPRQNVILGTQYIIIKENSTYRFATIEDFGGDKKNYLPPLFGSIEDNIDYLMKKKKSFDYIIEIENTAINNRIDLFCHRGLAREIAVLYDLELIEESNLLYTGSSIALSENIFQIQTDKVVSVCAVSATCREVHSYISYVFQLSNLNVTCHSFLIDISNFVMLDIGQSLHVFDSSNINQLYITTKASGLLSCLDNTTIEIDKGVLVITDQNHDIKNLVGIIGGISSAVTENTKNIIIESTAITPDIIRSEAKFYNKKTESALRNERAAIPLGPTIAIRRMLKIINDYHTIKIHEKQFFFNDTDHENRYIDVNTDYINKVLGNNIDSLQMQTILKKLGCQIIQSNLNSFKIRIPWWRQDLNNLDDIAEEIIRIIGFENIVLKVPQLPCQYKKYDNKRYILKKLTSLLASSHEVFIYGLDNTTINSTWHYDDKNQVPLINGYSQIQKTLIKSALPSLLNILYQIIAKQGTPSYSLFTLSPIWEYNLQKNIHEKKYYSILFYQEKYQYSFYDYKKKIEQIFCAQNIPLEFYSIQDNVNHNLYTNIASSIYCQGEIVGHCGFINPINFHFATKKRGVVFACEINITNLLSHYIEKKNYEYFFDISIIIEYGLLIEDIIKRIMQAFGNIMDIRVIDWYQSSEWNNQKSVTLRVYTINADISFSYEEIKKYINTQGYNVR